MMRKPSRRTVIFAVSLTILILLVTFFICLTILQLKSEHAKTDLPRLSEKFYQKNAFIANFSESYFDNPSIFKHQMLQCYQENKKAIQQASKGTSPIFNEPRPQLKFEQIPIPEIDIDLILDPNFAEKLFYSKASFNFCRKWLVSENATISRDLDKSIKISSVEVLLGISRSKTLQPLITHINNLYFEAYRTVIDLQILEKIYAYLSSSEAMEAIKERLKSAPLPEDDRNRIIMFNSRLSLASFSFFQKELQLELSKFEERYYSKLGIFVRICCAIQFRRTCTVKLCLPDGAILRSPACSIAEINGNSNETPDFQVVDRITPEPGSLLIKFEEPTEDQWLRCSKADDVYILKSQIPKLREEHFLNGCPTSELNLKGKQVLNDMVKAQLAFADKYAFDHVVVDLNPEIFKKYLRDHLGTAYRQLNSNIKEMKIKQY